MTTTDRVSIGRMLAVFLAVIIMANMALAAVSYFFPNLPIPSAMGIILAMVAAMSAGQSGAKAVSRLLTRGEKVRFAILATLLSTVIGVGFFWGIFRYYGVPFTLENIALAGTGDAIPADELRSILAWVVPIVLVLYVAVTYFGATLGSRNQIKLQEKLAANSK
jgi:uncharacterized integral membrane protein